MVDMSIVPTSALVGAGILSLFTCLLLVITQGWHGHLSHDHAAGVQKVHSTPTPRVGGIAIALGALLGWYLLPMDSARLLAPMLVAGVPCFVFGLAEDLTKRVSVKARLLATMGSGVLAWWITGISLSRIGVIGIDALLMWLPFSVAFTAFAAGGIANAINIIDGFNGLASGVLVLAFLAFAAIAAGAGDVAMAPLCLVLAAVTLGFWAVNFPFGKIFLGDGGAYLLGFWLAWVAIMLPTRNPQVSPWASMAVCAYPVIEVVFSVLRRLLTRASPGAPDSLHLHSMLSAALARRLTRNWTPALRNAAVSPLVWGFAAMPCVVAVLVPGQSRLLATLVGLAVVLYAACYLLVWSVQKGATSADARAQPELDDCDRDGNSPQASPRRV